MPIPMPNKNQNETEKKFISRCMANPTMVAEYDQSIRAGICYGQWRKSKGGVIKNSLRQGSKGGDILFNTGQLISEGYNKKVAKTIASFYANGEY